MSGRRPGSGLAKGSRQIGFGQQQIVDDFQPGLGDSLGDGIEHPHRGAGGRAAALGKGFVAGGAARLARIGNEIAILGAVQA